LSGYVYRIAKITGWGFREIVEELPFAAGLQLLHCDGMANGQPRVWTNTQAGNSVDALALLDEAFAKYGKQI
jgi:hypothetical protein